jgi:glycosyltransferase involved in cell wall biosynthesis
MKILYIASRITGDGGVQRVLSIKTNYFVENFGYQIDIITSNEEKCDLFFDFNKKVGLHFIKLSKNKLFKFFKYKKEIQKKITQVSPDCIIVCDFGLKGFLIPFLVKTKVPLIFEAHGSKYNESQFYEVNFFSKLTHKLKYLYRDFCVKKFDFFVTLSKESLAEWSRKDGIIIPNPLRTESVSISNLKGKKVIAVSRHSYEKGLDRLLEIWVKIIQKYPDWILNVYGSFDENKTYLKLAKQLDLEKSVAFFEPVQNIQEKYQESSICVMTSRSEGFPMVLLEAMASGLPCVAFDCPVGPRALISNTENGFLIQENQIDEFALKVNLLIENNDLAKIMGQKGISSVKKYNTESIMKQWVDLFQSLVKK